MSTIRTRDNWRPNQLLENSSNSGVDQTAIQEDSSDCQEPLNDNTLINGVPWKKLKLKLENKSFDVLKFTVSY